MCGRYFIAEEHSETEMQRIINEVNRRNREMEIKTSGEIFPSDTVPVVAMNRREEPGVFAMQWGFTYEGRRIINARSETAVQKPMFADGMKNRRCLVPATNYFEWEKNGRNSTKYEIKGPDGIIWMAGIYRFEEGKPVFTILTRESAESIAFIHDRMPVLLEGAERAEWLNYGFGAGDVLAKAFTGVRSRPLSGQIAMF